MVATIMQEGVENRLRNRLTVAATHELACLNSLVQDVRISATPDARCLLNGAPFTTKGAYKALSSELSSPGLMEIWQSRVPNKVKVFGWLLYLDRLNTRANLLHKHMIQDESCPRCSHASGCRDHIFFKCLAARRVWRGIGIRPRFNPTSNIWASTIPSHLPTTLNPFIHLTALWKINQMVFNGVSLTHLDTIRAIRDDITM